MQQITLFVWSGAIFIFLKNVAANAIKSMYKSSIVKTHYQ